jgi:hypothetical protein
MVLCFHKVVKRKPPAVNSIRLDAFVFFASDSMSTGDFKRRPTAILSADVEAHSRLMREYEETTVRTITSYRTVVTHLIELYRGRVVDAMLIVESHVTQHPNDKQEIEPSLVNLSTLPEEMGKVMALAADSGYFSEDNVERCEANGIAPHIPAGRQGHNQRLEKLLCATPPSPKGDDPVAKMKHRLKTPEGKGVFAKRKRTVEKAFGIIKAMMGFRQFLLRGLQSVLGEWDLVCIAYNLKRLHTLAPARG